MDYTRYLLQRLNDLYKKFGSSNSEKRALITFIFIVSVNLFLIIWIVSPEGKYLSDFTLFFPLLQTELVFL
jgi:hypothetical protein